MTFPNQATLAAGTLDDVDGQGTPHSALIANIGAAVDAATAAIATLGSAATHSASDFQPTDSDLTAIAALSTTPFGRSLLTQADAAALRTAAGLGSAATASTADFDAAGSAAAAQAASQPLDSDLTAIAALTTTTFGRALLALADATAARTTLGLGGSATLNVGTATGTVAAGDDSRITGAAQKSSNLSDLANAGTARTNLGLGGAATLNVGTTTGTVAAGDDSRITGAAQKASNLSDLPNAGTARTNLGLGTSATQASTAFVASGTDGTSAGNVTGIQGVPVPGHTASVIQHCATVAMGIV